MGLKTIRRPGRPRAQAIEPGDRPQLSFRVTADLMDKLAAARRQSGRSQAAECEHRLARSFDRQSLFKEVLLLRYGEQIAGLLSKAGDKLERFDVRYIDGFSLNVRRGSRGSYDVDVVAPLVKKGDAK